MRRLLAAPLDQEEQPHLTLNLLPSFCLFSALLLKDNKSSSKLSKQALPSILSYRLQKPLAQKTICPHKNVPNFALCVSVSLMPSPFTWKFCLSEAKEEFQLPPLSFHVKEENMVVILAATGYKCPETPDHMNSNSIASILEILRSDIVLLLSFDIWLQKNWFYVFSGK